MILGLVCGNGNLPAVLLEKHPYCICALLGDEPVNINLASKYQKFTLTQIPEILDFFKKNGVTHICLAGSVKKPKITIEMFGIRAISLALRLLILRNKGDNTLLTTLLNYITERGFVMTGITELAPSILAKEGVITKIGITTADKRSIELACKFLNDIAKYDVAQSCIVQDCTITAVEGIDGTATMIVRMKAYNDGAILVKMPKVGQTMKVDMPTIGLETIHQCISSGVKGIAIKSQETIILDVERVVEVANQNGIFIISIV